MSTEELKSLACHHLQAAWMPCCLQSADANKHISHQDIQYDHDPPCLEQVRRAICAACPDLILTIEDVLAEGKQVATRWTLQGTDIRGYGGRLPTGRQITTTGIQMARFERKSPRGGLGNCRSAGDPLSTRLSVHSRATQDHCSAL